jgi:hypothetical protein
VQKQLVLMCTAYLETIRLRPRRAAE